MKDFVQVAAEAESEAGSVHRTPSRAAEERLTERSPFARVLFGSELKRDLLIIAVIAAGAGFAMVKNSADGVQMRNFSRQVDGGTARFSFVLENHAARPFTAVVTVSAANAHEGHEGLQLWPIGVTNMEVNLAAHERKKVGGVIYFGAAGGATVLSHYLRVMPPSAVPSSARGYGQWDAKLITPLWKSPDFSGKLGAIGKTNTSHLSLEEFLSR